MITIIGTGLAGYTLAREFRKLDQQIPLRLITSDDGVFYSKPMLSNALAQQKSPQALAMQTAEQMAAQLNAEIVTHRQVVAVDIEEHLVRLDNHASHAYEQLVFACGASQIRLPLDGEVLSVNSLQDYRDFRGRLEGAKHIAIMGAGLIGCEFANDLQQSGYQVTLIDPADQPLSRLIPPEAGKLMQQQLAAIGVEWQFNTVVDSLLTDASGTLLQLQNGISLQADLVLSAVGLQPNRQLAADLGLTTRRGIVVGRDLQTSHANIFALGDCAEVEGLVLPYVMPLMHSARALAKTLAGEPTAVAYPAMPVVVKTPACPTVIVPPMIERGEWQITIEGHDLTAKCMDGEQSQGFVLMGAEAIKQKQTLLKQVPSWL